MSDKLDFSGFEAPPVHETPEKPEATQPARRRRKKTGQSASRRKRRVNVSIETDLSRRMTVEADTRGTTLSDLLRSAYTTNAADFDGSLLDPNPAPFSVQTTGQSGRIVHMLYLTNDEVEILDDLAANFASSRSGVVAALFTALSR